MQAHQIIQKYISFFENKGHKRIPNASLVPQDDPTTLFTSSGMQPLLPYLLGETHPDGKNLVNVQNCIRTQDIEEVGDNRHTTFFRMLGNWSLGDYFKEKEIPWLWEFLIKELQLPPKKLFITVFNGINDIPKDKEAVTIWNDVLRKDGLNPEERISYYSDKTNWWSRSGVPDKMPAGEPGGPSTEIFYEFDIPHNPKFGKDCHPNCDCGRFMEIGNSVFMEYIKQKDGSFKTLPKKNIDFGGGLERLAAAINNDPDVFNTDLYKEIIEEIENVTGKQYTNNKNKTSMRVIADHLKAATFLIKDGVIPSNKEHGYILRRLLRRSAVKMFQLKGGLTPSGSFQTIIDRGVLQVEEQIPGSGINKFELRDKIFTIIDEEMDRFSSSLDRGLKIFESYSDDQLNALNAFGLYQSYGFPVEVTKELFQQKGKQLNMDEFKEISQAHKQLSQTASARKFRGGLADHSEKTIMGHTATHLLHQALRDVLGNHVHQTGSNITAERIRFDFNYDQKLTDEQLKKVEDIVNGKIEENLPVHFEMINTQEAKKMGAIGLFMDTYGERSKIYFIGGDSKNPSASYSIEFCGGPHVDFTGSLKRFKIIKQENVGHGQRRIYSVVNK